MKAKLLKYDGTFKDTRPGYKAVSYDLANVIYVHGDSHKERDGRILATVKLDKENKEVGIEKLLIIPVTSYPSSDNFAYWFKTDTPKMCKTRDDLHTNLNYIMTLAMKFVGNVAEATTTAMYIEGSMTPPIIDVSAIDKDVLAGFEVAFCKRWIPELLSKKLMKLTEPKPEPKAEISRSEQDLSSFMGRLIHPEQEGVLGCSSLGEKSHPAIGPDDNPPLTTL